MRKLKTTLAILSLISPLGVNAMGVGDIKLHSALNQNLRAEIPLVNAKPKSISDIRISLAPPAAFARVGIERPFYLSSFRFKPIIKTDGSIVVKITSIDVIREPFVDFLLDVSWPQRHILREFTLFLDPPVFFQKKSVPVSSPPVTKTHRPAIAPVSSENNVIASSVATTNPISYSSAPAPEPIPPKTPERFKARSPEPTSRAYGFGEKYGPVTKKGTLWGIVNSIKPENGVSSEQLLIGIYRENRHAFFKNNINALKAGQTLTIPTRDVIVQLSNEQASIEYKRQNDVWYGRISDASPKKAKTTKLSKKSVEASNQLKLVSPSNEELSEAGASVNEIASENANSKADLALEMATSMGQENQQLQMRLAALEQQLVSMQRILALKDEQLAAMQTQNSQQPKPTVLPKEPVASASINLPKQTVQAKAVPKAQPVKKPVKPTLKNPKPAKSVSEAKPNDLLSEFLSEPFYLAAAGAGIVLLGLFAWVIIRKRRNESEDDIESILVLPEVGHDFANENPEGSDANDLTKKESKEPIESSFLSEFTSSEFDSIDSENDEVDAISEADVYLAYGRYQQAEDLIQQVIKDEPGNDECKLKLLEINFAKGSKEAFAAYASELSKDRRDDRVFWQKVVEMGRDLCPDNPLFSDTEEASAQDHTGSSELNVVLPDPENENSSLEFDASPSDANETATLDNISEFTSAPELDVALPDPENENSSLEFDVLPPVVDETDDVRTDATQDLDTDWDDDRQIELLDTESNDNQNSVESAEPSLDDDVVLEFSRPESIPDNLVEDLSIDLNVENEPEALQTGDASELDSYLVGSDVETVPREKEQSMDDDFDSLTDMDEVETKLDLAKAYVDMEDSGAAQDILREIFEQGSEEQKTEDQDLMEKLQING